MSFSPGYIVSARQATASKGSADALAEFGQAEPVLAAVAGKLTLSGAPTELAQGSHEEMLALVLTCVQAQRRGPYELGKDTLTGTAKEGGIRTSDSSLILPEG